MIELDVEAKRKPVEIAPDVPNRYLVLGDFGGRAIGPTPVDRDNLDAALASSGLTVNGVPFREIEDFHPDRLYKALDVFKGLRQPEPEPETPPIRPQSSPLAPLQDIIRSSSLLEQIAEGGYPFTKYVEELAHSHAAPAPAVSARKNAELVERMRAVLHHPRFQELEAMWRGLDFIVRRVDDESSRIHMAQLSKQDLAADLGQASDLRSTRVYSLIHGRKWRGVFGLYTFGEGADDIELLGRLALIASNARATFVAEGSPDIGPHWEELRSIPEAGYLGLALPRFLLRLPYGARTSAIESFEFEEMPEPPAHSAYLWGHPALACLAVLTQPGANEDSDDIGLDLENLPLHTYREDGETKTTPCAEVLMTETQVRALIDLGLMPLVSFRDSDRVRLAGLRAINGKALPIVI